MQITASPSHKRGQTDTTGDEPSPIRKRTDPQTPAQVLDGWLSRLERMPHGEIDSLKTTLGLISRGSYLPNMNAEFNTLIQHEEYGVFVEVFKAWCACCGTPEDPFQASLVLQLPPDWTPTHPAEMENAFREIQVWRVEVRSDEKNASASHPIPEAVGKCVAALLRGGTRELHVCAGLVAPHWVAYEIEHSQLVSVSLGNPAIGRRPATLDSTESASYDLLMKRLANCATLEKVELFQVSLQEWAHNVTRCANQPKGTRFQSVSGDSKEGTPVMTLTRMRMNNPSGIDYTVADGDRQTHVVFTTPVAHPGSFSLFLGGEESMQDVIAFLRDEVRTDAAKTMKIVLAGKLIDVDKGKGKGKGKDFLDQVDPRREGGCKCYLVWS